MAAQPTAPQQFGVLLTDNTHLGPVWLDPNPGCGICLKANVDGTQIYLKVASELPDLPADAAATVIILSAGGAKRRYNPPQEALPMLWRDGAALWFLPNVPVGLTRAVLVFGPENCPNLRVEIERA